MALIADRHCYASPRTLLIHARLVQTVCPLWAPAGSRPIIARNASRQQRARGPRRPVRGGMPMEREAHCGRRMSFPTLISLYAITLARLRLRPRSSIPTRVPRQKLDSNATSFPYQAFSCGISGEHPRLLGSLVGRFQSASDPRYGRLCRRRRHRRPLKGCTSGRQAPQCTAAASVVRSAALEFADKYLGRTCISDTAILLR